MSSASTSDASTRWLLYALLIVIATALMAARIARVRSPDPKNPTPFLSANDRSRWAAIRALGDDGTYAIEHIIFDARGGRVLGWHTIDLVRHRGRDGREHYYSSKPTLLTTLLAGEYWLLKTLTGATLAEHPHYVARIMLVVTNLLPLAAALVLLAALIDRLAATTAARVFAVAAAAFGTFVTTFVITLNNHSVAAVSLVVALAAAWPIWQSGRRAWWRFVVAGLALAFMAANELPALALAVLAGGALAYAAPLRTALGLVPAAVVVAAAAVGTNVLAHGDWRPPYAHRSEGPVIGRLSDRFGAELNAGQAPSELVAELRAQGIHLSERPAVETRVRGDRWVLWDEATQTRLLLARTPEGGPAAILVRQWDNWYDYEGSYWRPENLRGTDRGEASPLVYALHVLVGHHGLFSLTPLWLLTAAGCGLWIARGSPAERGLALLTVLTTAVVVGFYLTRPQIDRNYGGVTCCLRWLVWLTPLWLVTLLPAADWLSRRRWGQALGLVLLAISCFSAHYAADNPFSHPWLFDYWTWLGWIGY